MKRTRSLVGIGIIAGLFAFFDFYGMHYLLYDRVFWYDIMMHMFGGFVIALSYLWIIEYTLPAKRRIWSRLLPTLMFIFLIGLVWELYEWYLGTGASVFMPYWMDTIKDLADDLIGGTVGYLFCTMLIWKKN